MLKENRRTLALTSLVTALPMLAGVYFWNRLPEPMATHFGMEGEANGYSSRAFVVFGLPLFCLAVLWVCALVTARDPRRQNISPRLYGLVLWIIPIVSVVTSVMAYSFNLGYQADIPLMGELLVSLLFIVVGNYLPKVRQNYTIGIKIPWTLDNEENWNRTHRLAGYLWMAGGIALLLLSLCGILSSGWLMGITLCIVLVPCAYSFWLHARRSL